MIEIKKSLVTINEKVFEYAIKGAKGPAILLINGAGGPIESWSRIWNQIGLDDNIVFAYNRLGIDNSSKPKEPQTGSVIVKDLKDLLLNLKIEPPYLIVGHSLGGFIAHLFAITHPDDVHGLLFLESSTIKDVLNNLKRPKVSDLNKFSEVDHVITTTKQIQEAGIFPNIPITVVIGGKPAFWWIMPRKIKEARMNNQKELVNLSGKGSIVIAKKSGHFPQFTEPMLIANEINSLLKEIKE